LSTLPVSVAVASAWLGLIKQVGGTFKYYLTALGQRAIVAALAVKQFTVLPARTPAN